MKHYFLLLTQLLMCTLLIVSCGDNNSTTEYTVSTTSTVGGTISPESITVTNGREAVFTVVADSGFTIDSVSGCGGTLSAGTYTTTGITADCVVEATFTEFFSRVSVSGRILDATGKSIEGVEVFNEPGVLDISDSFGEVDFFLDPFNDLMTVQLRKADYTTQTVVLDVLSGSADFTGTMSKRNLPITVNADSTFNITGQYGAKVQVTGGTLVDPLGNAVTGDIELSITPVDVSDDDQLKVFPGAYSGFDAQGTPLPLVMPYGTVEYFLSQNGEELNLAPGATATIEIPTFVTQHPDGSAIEVGQQNQIIWYLDEVTGQWIEEARGTVVASENSPTGLAVIATISHFSWWNFDYAAGGPGGGSDNVDAPPFDEVACEIPMVLNNLPTGLDQLKVYGDFYSVDNNRPRSGGLMQIANNLTFFFPRDQDIAVDAYIVSSPVVNYTASTMFRCSDGMVTLNFTGPLAPIIQNFEVSIKPVFELSSNNLYEVVSNIATASWTVLGHDSLNLAEPELPINMPLPVAQGSVDIPLQQPAVVDDVFSFTLTAQNSSAQASLVESSIAYVLEAPPLVERFAFFFTSGPGVQISWDTEGADTINIHYVRNGDSLENLTNLTGQMNISGSSATFPFSLIPNGGYGYQIVVEYVNQYGSTYRTFSRGDCPPETDLC